MKLYIVDDDSTVIKMIEEIILDNTLGEIVGMSSNSLNALEEVCLLKPDLVLVDLLMPDLDGITFVERLLTRSPDTKSIMISQVSSKKIVGDAYEKGITFFISKPVNKKELTQVIRNIGNQIKMENSLNRIKKVFQMDDGLLSNRDEIRSYEHSDDEKKFRMIFSKLGILGESGCDEIIKICHYMKNKGSSSNQLKLMDLTNELSDNPKAMEQRIRRTINKGLSNVANLGIEDYLNETFVNYSNTLFDFDQVRLEMEYVRGKKKSGGKINIKKFLDNLLLIAEEM